MQIGSSIAKLAEPLRIGDIELDNRVLLAPMSGISDRPFRDLVMGFGAGAVVSEMVASDQLAGGKPVARMKAERGRGKPHIVQLAGREARWMAEGARAATDAGADIIDINMGCPARKVTGGLSGSALMRDLDHAVDLIDATVGATDRPVTLKMRLGWDAAAINAPELAARAEASGIAMVTVHGRTRSQFFKGRADWAAIRAVKAAVTIPVIANGDLTDVDDLATMLDQSGADGVMIGRGACGRPWFPGHLAAHARSSRAIAPAPTGSAWADLVVGHHDAILDHYGPRVGIRAARKHLGWYLDGLDRSSVPAALRQELLTALDVPAIHGILRRLGDIVQPANIAA